MHPAHFVAPALLIGGLAAVQLYSVLQPLLSPHVSAGKNTINLLFERLWGIALLNTHVNVPVLQLC
jgi:hypothetical protein